MCVFMEVLAKVIALNRGVSVELNEEELTALHEAEQRALKYMTKGETQDGTSD